MSKRDLKSGNYRTLATIKIGDGEQLMLLDDFLASIKQAQKILSMSAKTVSDAEIRIGDVSSAALEELKSNRDIAKSFTVVEGLEQPELSLHLNAKQAQLDDDLLKSKENLIKSDLEQTILTGNRIAEQLAANSMNALELAEVIEGNKDELSLRSIIAVASKPSLNIQIENGPNLSVGGGLAVPRQLVKGDPINIENCQVVSITKRGIVKIQVFDKDESSEGQLLEVHVKTKTREFDLLNLSYIFNCRIDCQLVTFEKVSNLKERFELMEVTNQKAILEILMDKLKFWDSEV